MQHDQTPAVVITPLKAALIHGLAGRTRGHIVVTGRRVGGNVAGGDERVDLVELVVEDDGHGIESDALERVFEPFYTTRAGEGGSGLGLSIVHNLVSGLLGGDIALTSAPGAGARFCLTLPIVAKAR